VTPRQRKPWNKGIEESGTAVRVCERALESLLYREVRLDGEKDRHSLGPRDRVLAEQQGRALARRVAELRLTGHTGSRAAHHTSAEQSQQAHRRHACLDRLDLT
jgi:hypothetical protein